MNIRSHFSDVVTIYFWVLSAGFALTLPFGLIRYLRREKLADHYRAMEDRRKNRFLFYSRLLVLFSRVLLVGSPLLLFFIPYALYIYGGIPPVPAMILVVCVTISVLQYYLFHGWLIGLLGSDRGPASEPKQPE